MNDIIHVFFSSDQQFSLASWWTSFALVFSVFQCVIRISFRFGPFFRARDMSQTESRRSYIVYLMSATFYMKVPSFLMHIEFFEKTDQKIVSIDDISRYITIYRDIISQLIGLTYRRFYHDIMAI